MHSKLFKSRYSPAVINKPSTGSNDILADWQRALPNPNNPDGGSAVTVKINGKLLSEYSGKHKDFDTKEHLQHFLREVVLSKTDLDQNKQDSIVKYLMTSFHQGGLMYPVSSALGECMKETDKLTGKPSSFGTLKDSGLKHTINIVSTPHGFKVQEFCLVKKIVILEGSSMGHLFDRVNPTLDPEEGHDYLIHAQGTIDVDFSEDPAKPKIAVESNTIDFGHKALETRMSSRTLTQMMMDFLRNLVGLNKVYDLSTTDETPHLKL